MKKGICPATGSTREIRAWSDRIHNSATDKPAAYYNYQITHESGLSAPQKNMQLLLVEFNTLQKSFSLLFLYRFFNTHQALNNDLLPLGYQQALHPWPSLKMTEASLQLSNLEKVIQRTKILFKDQNHQINISTTIFLDWGHHCRNLNAVFSFVPLTTRQTSRC